ncbi:MAG: hypothetical protein JSV34_05615 [Candidatus Omnitrophota bacterium]|nr:MAG: hypothetical protein JSV34_05615 [Candidatus Omnitrophota bacterium]
MVRFLDNIEREKAIFDLVIESYVEESKPISSSYLCGKYNLPCSTATVRNVMVSLEKKGYLSHIHTSSGRVPTKEGFKYYVHRLKQEDFIKDYSVDIDLYLQRIYDESQPVNYILNILAEMSGYTSLLAISGRDDKLFFKGTRFILEQPEFEDIGMLKDLFCVFETKIDEFQQVLFRYLDDGVSILIGDDIGVEEISECALVVSGLRKEPVMCALGLLGPVRMNYVKAASCLNAISSQFKEVMGALV